RTQTIGLRSATVPQIVLGIGVAREKSVESSAEFIANRLSARLAEQVESLARIGLHVVQLVRPVGMAPYELPTLAANRAADIVLVVDRIVPHDLVPAQRIGEIAAGQLGLGWQPIAEPKIVDDRREKVVVAD